MRRALLIALLMLSAHGAAAYTHVVQREGSQLIRLAWPLRAMPIRLMLSDQINGGLTNVIAGSDPRAALMRALTVWPAVSSVQFETEDTDILSAGQDGVNLITFADTDANAAALEMAGDPIALTLYFFVDDALTEADVLLNPRKRFTTTATSEDELEAQGASDIEAVAVHELGHAIGLNHSGVESASMWGFTSLGQRTLDPDDIAAAQALYPLAAATGSIAGTVRVNGRAAFGAQVVAVDQAGIVRGALTLPDGSYRIEALPPDTYTAYVEPLDGPHGAAFVDGCVQFGNMGGAGIYDGAELTTNFSTTFYGGNETPVDLTLEASHLVLADFDVPAGISTLNPTRIGPGAADGAFARLAEFPLDVTTGMRQWVAMAGPGLDRVDAAGVVILGAGIAVDASTLQRPDVSCGGEPFPTMIFAIDVTVDAAAGGRSILVSSGDDRAALSGALRVRAASAPIPCIGDCNGDRRISVDELVVGVNISLDRTTLASCPDFDRDANQHVTVDELIGGVNGLLAGCSDQLLGVSANPSE